MKRAPVLPRAKINTLIEVILEEEAEQVPLRKFLSSSEAFQCCFILYPLGRQKVGTRIFQWFLDRHRVFQWFLGNKVRARSASVNCSPLDLLGAEITLPRRQGSSAQPVHWPNVCGSLISSVSSHFVSVSFHFLSFAALPGRVACTLLDLLDMAKCNKYH